MSAASPRSMAIACPVLGRARLAVIDSRCVAQALREGGTESGGLNPGNWTQRNGKSPSPPDHSDRQLRISVSNCARYAVACSSLFAFDSPWYHSTPLMGSRCSGLSIALYNTVGILLTRWP